MVYHYEMKEERQRSKTEDVFVDYSLTELQLVLKL